MPKHKIDDLNRIYSDGEQCDQDVYAEMRSNVLLAAGEHYNRKRSGWWDRIRESRDISNEQKLRLTKNHIHKISKTYINNIVSQSPGVIPTPNNPKELQDQKAAELNRSVWEFAKVQHQLKIKTQSEAKDYIEIGEVACKIFWDPNAGRFLGYEQELDEEGSPLVDENGEPLQSDRAVFTGDLVFERIYGFNLIRAAEAKTMSESPWLCNRKMIHLDDLKKIVGDDPEKQKHIVSSRDETYFVFDSSRNSYNKADNQALWREFFFRPCLLYPNGYFYIALKDAILFEGELPFGVFPIVYEGFDEIATTPRHRSIIKQLRPYQVEINRSSSKIAEHQVTLGDDKIILQNGSKMTSGPHAPGIRTLMVTGQQPTVLEGRTGSQYLDYVNSQIAEMYQVANVAEDSQEKEGGDPFVNLYKAVKDKKKFSIYAEKFENYQINKCKTYLELAKNYFDANMLIPAIGRSEYINIEEFKRAEPLSYQIKIEPNSDDTTSLMGRHLSLNWILQYVGQNLQRDDIGKLIRQMPFANHEESFSDLTIDYDMATNIILALDRGDVPTPSKQDNDQYILKRLSSRQKQTDYALLNPQIRANYDQMIEYYEQISADKAAQIKAAQSDFIPSSGAMIKVDYYIPDPNNKTRSIRATLPAESIDWLIKRLEEQGSAQQQLAGQTTSVQADIARLLMNGQQMMPSGLPQGGLQ